jgi:hypothetical protein
MALKPLEILEKGAQSFTEESSVKEGLASSLSC